MKQNQDQLFTQLMKFNNPKAKTRLVRRVMKRKNKERYGTVRYHRLAKQTEFTDENDFPQMKA